MLLALLINLSTSAPAPDVVKAGRTSGKKRKYVVEIAGSLYQFSSKDSAINALENAKKPLEVVPLVEVAQTETKGVEYKEPPIAIVSIQEIQQLAIERQADTLFQNYLQAMKYNAMYALYEQLQEEQDVELLLMAV